MLNQPHGCPDWDFMWIKPGDPEMECCTCEPSAAALQCCICSGPEPVIREFGSDMRLVCDPCYRAAFTDKGCGGWE